MGCIDHGMGQEDGWDVWIELTNFGFQHQAQAIAQKLVHVSQRKSLRIGTGQQGGAS